MLSLKSRVSRNSRVPWRIIEKEAILVNVDKGEVIHLNEVGAEIWNTLNGRKSVEDIGDHLHHTFEVSREEAQRDALEFLSRLIQKKLLLLSRSKIKDK